MIEVPEGIDRGKYLYSKYKQSVTNYVVDRKETYFDSQKVYKSLVNRVKIIDDVINLVFPQNAGFVAEIAMPIVRKRWREINAFVRKYFEADPLVTYQAIGGTPEQNARNRTQLVNRNFVSTRYREKCFRWMIDSAARYGSYVTFTQYEEKVGQSLGKKTIYDPNALAPYRRGFQQGRKQNAVTYPVHILNYFCDPEKTPYCKGAYEGVIDRWPISYLYTLLGNESYIQENVEAIINKCKDGTTDQHWYGGNGEGEIKDYSREKVDVSRMYTTLPFKGNEDDATEYYIEFIDNKIMRINESGLDNNERPITTSSLLNRPNVWWGNSDIEDVIPHQNVSNWLYNTSFENTLKMMDSFTLVNRGAIDLADWNNRHQLGGAVFVDTNRPLNELMYQYQTRDNSLNSVDWMARELKQSIQESSPIVNMQNKYNEGGLNNSTLGAAQMVASIGEVLQYDMMNNFQYGLIHQSEVSANILEIMLDDEFTMPVNKQYQIMQKHEIMGEFQGIVESTLTLNDQTQFSNYVNRLTQFLNWAGTGRPEFNNVNYKKMIQDVLKTGNKWYSDIEDYYQEQPQQPMLPPGMPQQGQPAPQPQMAGAMQ